MTVIRNVVSTSDTYCNTILNAMRGCMVTMVMVTAYTNGIQVVGIISVKLSLCTRVQYVA